MACINKWIYAKGHYWCDICQAPYNAVTVNASIDI